MGLGRVEVDGLLMVNGRVSCAEGKATRAMHVRPGIIAKLKRGNEPTVRLHQRVFPPLSQHFYDPDTPLCLRWTLRSSPRETVRVVSSVGSTTISTFSGSTSSFCELNSSHFGSVATLVDPPAAPSSLSSSPSSYTHPMAKITYRTPMPSSSASPPQQSQVSLQLI